MNSRKTEIKLEYLDKMLEKKPDLNRQFDDYLKDQASFRDQPCSFNPYFSQKKLWESLSI